MVVDLVLDVVEVALADVEQPVRHRAARAGQLVDEVAPGRRLRRGEDLAGARLGHVARIERHSPRAQRHEGGDVADEADGDLAVEVDAPDELDDVEHVLRDRHADQRRVVPHGRGPGPPERAHFQHDYERHPHDARVLGADRGRGPVGDCRLRAGAGVEPERAAEHGGGRRQARRGRRPGVVHTVVGGEVVDTA